MPPTLIRRAVFGAVLSALLVAVVAFFGAANDSRAQQARDVDWQKLRGPAVVQVDAGRVQTNQPDTVGGINRGQFQPVAHTVAAPVIVPTCRSGYLCAFSGDNYTGGRTDIPASWIAVDHCADLHRGPYSAAANTMNSFIWNGSFSIRFHVYGGCTGMKNGVGYITGWIDPGGKSPSMFYDNEASGINN